MIFQIPINSVVVGACWAQFVASGPKYSDMNNPQVMIKVGNVGDVGNIEIQDVLFTVKGATQGAVLLEWNAKAATQGSVAMWGNYNYFFLMVGITDLSIQTPTSALVGHSVQIFKQLNARLHQRAQLALLHRSLSTSPLEQAGTSRTSGPGQQIMTWTLALLRHKSISSAEEVSIDFSLPAVL